MRSVYDNEDNCKVHEPWNGGQRERKHAQLILQCHHCLHHRRIVLYAVYIVYYTISVIIIALLIKYCHHHHHSGENYDGDQDQPRPLVQPIIVLSQSQPHRNLKGISKKSERNLKGICAKSSFYLFHHCHHQKWLFYNLFNGKTILEKMGYPAFSSFPCLWPKISEGERCKEINDQSQNQVDKHNLASSDFLIQY